MPEVEAANKHSQVVALTRTNKPPEGPVCFIWDTEQAKVVAENLTFEAARLSRRQGQLVLW